LTFFDDQTVAFIEAYFSLLRIEDRVVEDVFLLGEEGPALFDGNLAKHSKLNAVYLFVVVFIRLIKAVPVMPIPVLLALLQGILIVVSDFDVLPVSFKDLLVLLHVGILFFIESVGRHNYDVVIV